MNRKSEKIILEIWKNSKLAFRKKTNKKYNNNLIIYYKIKIKNLNLR